MAAFESRRCVEMARLIERHGGVARVSPSMREVEIGENRPAIDFANRVITGQVDVMVLMTGVGVRHWLAEIERHVDRGRFLSALGDMTTVVRGPKPAAALKDLGITPTHRAPEPYTWREVLSVFDERLAIAQQTVGLQEYGQPSASLVAGLEARGAKVETLRIYCWELPADPGPLIENVRAIIAGDVDIALFTSGRQVVNLFRVAHGLGLDDELRQGLRRLTIGSIGPTTSESLRELELQVDFEPQHSQMGHLVSAAAERGPELARAKRFSASLIARPAAMPIEQPARLCEDSLFMRACRRRPVERTPIWLMRQAGRYMQEYRQVRAKTTFLELCKNPALCADVMLTAVDRLKVDAAIIFSDLLPILEPMGLSLEFAAGEGPVIHNPIRAASDVDRLIELESVDSLWFVTETVKRTRAGLPESIPVIGFAGAPFTLASYAIEGGGSRDFAHVKSLMWRDFGAWETIMSRFARSIARYLNAQIAAGAQAVQLFDSWVGALNPDDYRRFVLPFSRAVIRSILPGTPVIHFATGNPTLLPLLAEAGGDVIGVDWRVRLDDAWNAIGHDRAIQGNLDPTTLLADRDEIRRRAKAILDQAGGRPGHIFNLGHGVLQQTPVENVIALVDAVKELSGAVG